jgi:hypothetical protein
LYTTTKRQPLYIWFSNFKCYIKYGGSFNVQ